MDELTRKAIHLVRVALSPEAVKKAHARFVKDFPAIKEALSKNAFASYPVELRRLTLALENDPNINERFREACQMRLPGDAGRFARKGEAAMGYGIPMEPFAQRMPE